MDSIILEHSRQGNARSEKLGSAQLFLQAPLGSGYALFLSMDALLG